MIKHQQKNYTTSLSKSTQIKSAVQDYNTSQTEITSSEVRPIKSVPILDAGMNWFLMREDTIESSQVTLTSTAISKPS